MVKKIYEKAAMQEHEAELEQLMIDATSGDSTDQQLGKTRETPRDVAIAAENGTTYGNLW